MEITGNTIQVGGHVVAVILDTAPPANTGEFRRLMRHVNTVEDLDQARLICKALASNLTALAKQLDMQTGPSIEDLIG